MASRGSGGRVDLHTHVLPAVDDGARDDASALAMLRLAAADGTGTVVATPHGSRCDAAGVAAGVARLSALAAEAGIAVTVLPGSEQRLTADLPGRLRAGQVATIAGTPWVLVELALERWWPEWFARAIADLQLAGARPILAHAERYPAVQRDPWLLADAVAGGVLVQINGDALLGDGKGGAGSRRTAERLLRARLAHVIASDAHSPERRPPLLAAAFARAARLVGEEYAREIAGNAERIIAGAAITPPVPEPRDAGDGPGGRLWRRLRLGSRVR